MLHGNLTDLATLLHVSSLGKNRYLGHHPSDVRHRVYGGQFLGQGLMAAAAGVAAPIRSFHAQFLRPGSLASPIEYQRDQISPDCVHIDAVQTGKLAFCMDVAFGEPIPETSIELTTEPAMAIPREDGIVGLPTDTDASWACVDGPFETRFVERIWDIDYRDSGHTVWFRGRFNPSDDPHFAAAALAYFSDDTLMDNALFPHDWQRSWDDLVTASLDHTMWFHSHLALEPWMCFVQRSDVSAAGRGMTTGTIYDDQGQAMASVAQEILMRLPIRSAAR